MATVREQLLDMILVPEQAYNQSADDLAPRQLQAAQELLDDYRKRIPLLDRRATEAGIDRITSFDDLVPLLFAHSAYKSYPQGFFDKGQWDRMLKWLDTLSAVDVTQVDVSRVTNVDEWIEALWNAGYYVLATSGTSGKCSFLTQTAKDRKMKTRHFYHTVGFPFVKPTPRPVFWLGPSKGPNSAIESCNINRENWAAPGDFHCLSDEPLRISDVSKMASLRKRMAQGTATPNEIATFEADSVAKARAGESVLVEMANKILDRRHEPLLITGMWAQYMEIIRIARERGIADGDFHPDTVMMAGGGVKGIALPDDYKEQVDRFFGDVIKPGNYGMTEMAQLMPRCEAGRYHGAPGLIWMVLDGPGEKRLTAADADARGLVEGRFAFLDLLYEGRWGGVITGDKVTVDFSPRCACGRSGPTLLDNITRFASAGQDDHIGCAGTIDSYIRGALS